MHFPSKFSVSTRLPIKHRYGPRVLQLSSKQLFCHLLHSSGLVTARLQTPHLLLGVCSPCSQRKLTGKLCRLAGVGLRAPGGQQGGRPAGVWHAAPSQGRGAFWSLGTTALALQSSQNVCTQLPLLNPSLGEISRVGSKGF